MKGRERDGSNKGYSPVNYLKKRTMVSGLENTRRQRNQNVRASKTQLSISTFIELTPDNSKENLEKEQLRKEEPSRLQESRDQIKRARSLRSLVFEKPIGKEALDKNSANELNDNLLQLRIEEMTFKFKMKIGSLLKELNLSSEEMERFGLLLKIDDILHFLSGKVREKIVNTEMDEASMHKVRSKEKSTLSELEAELEMVRRKFKEKQMTEKELKNKVREAQMQSKEFLDKINLKEKELSSKITELYQLKSTLKENEKIFAHLQERYGLLEKETGGYREQLDSKSKDNLSVSNFLMEENSQLKGKVRELEEELVAAGARQTTLSQLKNQLTEEVARWRERFEDVQTNEGETKRSSQANTPITPIAYLGSHQKFDLRKSTMSMVNFTGGNQNTSNRFSLATLELQNMNLSRKVNQLQALTKEDSSDKLPSLTQSELQSEFKKKMSKAAEEWKDKLYEMVNKYEDQAQTLRQRMRGAQLGKEQYEIKVYQLVNDRYQFESRVIQLEKEKNELIKGRSGSGKERDKSRIYVPHYSEEESRLERAAESELELGDVLEVQEIQEGDGQLEVQEECNLLAQESCPGVSPSLNGLS